MRLFYLGAIMFPRHRKIQKAEVKSEPYDPRLFPQGQCTQATTVTVTMNEKDDGISECLGGCFSTCLGLTKKAATS